MIDSLSSVPSPLPPIDAGLDSTGVLNEKTSVPRMWSFSCAPSLAVGGQYKIAKKGQIEFATSEKNMVSCDGSLIIGGRKEDGDIGRIS